MRVLLLRWFRSHARDFPWRRTSDPYRILLAEIMLRRTRAEQVVPVYTSFVQRFPDIRALSAADAAEIRRLLRPLGLERRAREVVLLAQVLTDRGEDALHGEHLAGLPGVGPYVASAVRCFAWGERAVLVDAGTSRIACRLFGLRPRGEARRSRQVVGALDRIVGNGPAREINLALIDLGALVCRPKKPLCTVCPLVQMCNHGRRLNLRGAEARGF